MVEPLASVILTTFLLRRTPPPCHQHLKSILGVVGRPASSSAPSDFFTPHPRPCNGKARETADTECSYCAASSTRSDLSFCVARHSVWCPKTTRLLMTDEVNTRRSRHRRSIIPQSTRRHVSTAPHPFRGSPQHDASSSSLSESNAVFVRDLVTMLGVANDDFHLEEVWSIYETILHSGVHCSLSTTEILLFAEKLATASERACSGAVVDDDSRLWGSRIAVLMQEVEPRLARYSTQDLMRACLLARAHLLSGDVSQAIGVAKDAQGFPLDDYDKNKVLQLYQLIVSRMQKQLGEMHILDLLIKEWDFLGSYLYGRYSLYQHPDIISQARSFRQTTFKILSDITKPAIYLSERYKWVEPQKRRAGELLIEVYLREGFARDAMAVMDELGKQRISVSMQLQLNIVKALVRDDAFLQANALYSSLSHVSGTTFKFKLSTGLYLYAHQGDTTRAEECFEKLRHANWVTPADIGMLMHAYATPGNTEKVVALFHEFFPDDNREIEPHIIHYTALIFAHAQRADFDGLNHWLETMSKAGITPDIYVYNIVLKSFAIRREIDSIATILNQMCSAGIHPTRIVYTTIITLLAKRKDPDAAEAIYKRALREGIEPDRRMITSLMNAHVEAGSWRGVIRVFDYLKSAPSRKLRLSIEVFNTLLKAYVLIGAPFRVVTSTFRRLEEEGGVSPDTHTYTLLIQSACDSGLMQVALDIFDTMERTALNWQSSFHINSFALTIVMSGYLRLGDKVRAKAVYDDMRERGISPNSITFSHIIQAYGNEKTAESLQIAEDFLQQLMAQDPAERNWMSSSTRQVALEHVYRPLMLIYARQQRPEDTERLFQVMIEAGGEPSLGTLTMLLDAYRLDDNIQSARDVWSQIWKLALRYSNLGSLFHDDTTYSSTQPIKRQANLICIPLSIYIDMLSARGEHLEIAEVWGMVKAQGFSFDSHNWNHLAVALVRAGEPERAFEVVERVILPYQRHSERILNQRDDNPDSPLLFDIAPPKEEDPVPEAPMHKQKRRAQAAELATKRMGSLINVGEESDDFTHPLHILHQISPSWNIWRPHAATLHVLSKVLAHLDSGMTIQPIQSPDAHRMPSDEGSEQQAASAQTATETLERIYRNYPKAVKVVLDYERLQRRREVHSGRILGGWS